MSFIVASNISIGSAQQVLPAEVTVKKSINTITDTAVIKLPTRTRILKVQTGEKVENLKTAYQFKKGDVVVIRAGYKGSLKEEFRGFVSRVNYTSPVEIECEGFSYQLREKRYTRSWKNTTLKDVLEFLIVETDITLSPNVPDIPIDIWVMNNASGMDILEKLKEQLFLTIFFTGPELYAGLAYTEYKGTVTYRLGWNCLPDGLKLRQAPSAAVKIVIKGERPNGSNVQAAAGSGSNEPVTYTTRLVSDESALALMATVKLNEETYTGFEGTIPALAIPYCEPGYKVSLQNPYYPELNGQYLVASTDLSYGQQGCLRSVGIGIKVS